VDGDHGRHREPVAAGQLMIRTRKGTRDTPYHELIILARDCARTTDLHRRYGSGYMRMESPCSAKSSMQVIRTAGSVRRHAAAPEWDSERARIGPEPTGHGARFATGQILSSPLATTECRRSGSSSGCAGHAQATDHSSASRRHGARVCTKACENLGLQAEPKLTSAEAPAIRFLALRIQRHRTHGDE